MSMSMSMVVYITKIPDPWIAGYLAMACAMETAPGF